MLIFRWLMLLALLTCAALFLAYAFTGKDAYKKHGLLTLKITLAVALGFFIVLIFQRF